MSPAASLPVPTPHDRLIAAARDWLLRSWGRHLASIDCLFGDETVVSLAPRLSGLRVQPTGYMLPTRPFDAELFAAARAWGEMARGEYPERVHVNATDGSSAQLTVPHHPPLGPCEFTPDAPHSEDAPAWSFGDAAATYRGRRFRCAGLKLKLLRALAERPGAEVPNNTIIAAVWGDRYAADERQLRNLVCQLRSLLVDALALDADPVVACGGAHRLTLV